GVHVQPEHREMNLVDGEVEDGTRPGWIRARGQCNRRNERVASYNAGGDELAGLWRHAGDGDRNEVHHVALLCVGIRRRQDECEETQCNGGGRTWTHTPGRANRYGRGVMAHRTAPLTRACG